MNIKYLTIALALSLGLAACGGKSGDAAPPGPGNGSVDHNKVDECPRSDGTPCR